MCLNFFVKKLCLWATIYNKKQEWITKKITATFFSLLSDAFTKHNLHDLGTCKQRIMEE